MQFTYDEMSRLREARKRGLTMAQMCTLMGGHRRDEVVEAIDALVRHGDTRAAQKHVNDVLTLQGVGVPLVNGREAWRAVPLANRATLAPFHGER